MNLLKNLIIFIKMIKMGFSFSSPKKLGNTNSRISINFGKARQLVDFDINEDLKNVYVCCCTHLKTVDMTTSEITYSHNHWEDCCD